MWFQTVENGGFRPSLGWVQSALGLMEGNLGIWVRNLQVIMANEKVNEDEAEAILSNLKMEGRSLDLEHRTVSRCCIEFHQPLPGHYQVLTIIIHQI